MKKRKSNKKNLINNILIAIIVTILIPVLLNLTFLFDFFYQTLVRSFIEVFIPLNLESNLYWYPPLMHISFVIIIGIISFFVFKSKLKDIYKATYMSIPLAVVYVTIGIFTYPFEIISYSLSILFGITVLYCLFHNKKSWIYYYTFILISFLMLLVALFHIEI